jgi:hypothetical protein
LSISTAWKKEKQGRGRKKGGKEAEKDGRTYIDAGPRRKKASFFFCRYSRVEIILTLLTFEPELTLVRVFWYFEFVGTFLSRGWKRRAE